VPLVVACVGLRHLLLPRLECCVWVSVLQGNNRAGNSGLVWSGSFVSLPLPLTTSRMLPKNRRPNCTKCKLTKPSDNEPHGAKKQQQQQEEHPNVSVSVSAYLCNCVGLVISSPKQKFNYGAGKAEKAFRQIGKDRRPKTERRSPVAGLWFIISIVALVGKQSNDRRNRRRFPSLSTSVRFYCFRTSPSVRLPADILLYISGVSSIFPVFIWFIRFAVLFCSPRSPQINKYIVR